jgi:hypothetical protein
MIGKTRKSITQKQFIKYLDGLGVPADQLRRFGGKIPNRTKRYGIWLYVNNRVRFDTAFDTYKMHIQGRL